MAEILPVGTQVTCPKCGDHIATVLVDVSPGLINPAHFEMHQAGHGSGKPMVCTNCASKFAGWMIHTSEGWK